MKDPKFRITTTVAACLLTAACSDNYKLTTAPVTGSGGTTLSDNNSTTNPSNPSNPVTPNLPPNSGGCVLTNVTVPVKIMFVVNTPPDKFSSRQWMREQWVLMDRVPVPGDGSQQDVPRWFDQRVLQQI